MFFWVHKLLHTKYLYGHIHKLHHQYRVPVSIASEYTHPFEFLLGNVLAMAAPMLILGEKVHMYTFVLWALVRIGEGIDGHCGYDFPWSPYCVLPW